MRSLLAWTMTLAVGASTGSTAFGQALNTQTPRTAPTAPASKTSKAPNPLDPATIKAKAAAEARAREEMNLLLTEWEKQSKTVKSLHVVFERIDKSVKWGDQYYQGQAFLKSPDLACLEFKKAIADPGGKPKYSKDANGLMVLDVEKDPFQRIVCTGKDVLQYEWDVKEIYIYPLDKESRQKALQQGPLPFLFNMKAADAKKRYGMTLMDQNTKEYLIAIVPNEEIDKNSFNRAFVWLNKENFLPNKLVLYPVGDKDKQDFRFTLIAPNKAIPDGFFNPSTKLEGWKVTRNPPNDGKDPNAQAVVANPPRAVAAPARAAQAAPNRAAMQPASKNANPR